MWRMKSHIFSYMENAAKLDILFVLKGRMKKEKDLPS